MVRPRHKLLESGTLIGLAVNQSVIPFLGWIEAEFSLGQDSGATPPLLVPILVFTDPHVAEQPIIGFNVIEAVLSQQSVGSGKSISPGVPGRGKQTLD